MKESYIEGVATHNGPESCVVVRKEGSEALTGVHTGAVLSREIRQVRVPTLLTEAEGNTGRGDSASVVQALRGRRPVARVEPFCARTGRSLDLPPRPMVRRDASGRPEATS